MVRFRRYFVLYKIYAQHGDTAINTDLNLMIDIEKNIAAVKQQIRQALGKNCEDSGDKSKAAQAVRLIAVSKKQDVQAIIRAYECGVEHFGENYVQEAVAKINELREKSIIWHFIGPIQSNKTAAIAEHFSWVHSIDRLKIAQRLNNQRPDDLPPLNVCIQVNIDVEEGKSGVSVEALPALIDAISAMPRLRLRGLMAIPKPIHGEKAQSFIDMQHLFQLGRERIAQQANDFDTLSMGMSQDITAAIKHGATAVRVGTAIFGQR